MQFLYYFKKTLEKLNSEQYNFFYIYSDLRFFGRFKQPNLNKQQFLEVITSCLVDMNVTLVIPTFTYTTSGNFNVQKTKTHLGALNSYILDKVGIKRSEHPLFSFASLGEGCNLIKHIGKSAFGRNSVHERLIGRNTAFLYLGRPVSLGNTMIHYVEQLLNVDYRFEKVFPTNVYDEDNFLGNDYSAFVRKRDNLENNYTFSFKKAARILHSQGLIKQTMLENEYSNISLIPYDASLESLKDMLSKDENVFLQKKLLH